ncbi:HD domain-containing phosphohydrolase [Gilvimarinus algae]|uniref:Transporter substrate-binding domain-containing protein n=1 Tax=Gilvimarinus algae TaxID=3058037 RepID=A0ABT8TEH8_9GAMM|nr:HD domain-containing phosphohydrolase [Gilvimarinus sp. SDUM040014]MDO3382341.1 transporter substrate-binding domain-containing protein [Gilvimarinus sp. SDUM040014]
MHAQAPRRILRLPIRLLVVGIVALTMVVTATLAISLQYYFSRDMAIDAAIKRYQLTAGNTSEFIEAVETRGAQVTRLLSEYPALVTHAADHPHMRDLFAEVMRNNTIFYSIYVGFPNGDFYELVNLDNGPDVRAGVSANPEDRWVVNTVTQGEQGRVRQFYYYDEHFKLRQRVSEPSNYDVRERRWFTDATRGRVEKSSPYLFQYIQIPGQTYSIMLPDNGIVLGIDITLQSFSAYLQKQPLSREGEIYVYRSNGEVLASNRLARSTDVLPEVTPLELNQRQRDLIKSLGPVRISNEMDWPPIDFAVAGQPKGYSVDLIRSLAAMLQMDVEFINGYSWPELMDKFRAGDIDVLQPLLNSDRNRAMGVMSDPLMKLPYSVATRKGQPVINRLSELRGKTVAIPSGWTIIDIIKNQNLAVDILEVSNTKRALEAVSKGLADATIDSDAILRYTARQFFIENIQFGAILPSSGTVIPDELHLMVQTHNAPLVALFNQAIAALDSGVQQELKRRWFSDEPMAAADSLAVVPYKPLLDAASNKALLNVLRPVKIDGKKYFVFTDHLNRLDDRSDYFAVVIPYQNVLGPSLARVQVSILITIGCLLLLLPISWLCAEPIVRPINQLFGKSEKVKRRKYNEVSYCPSRIRELHELSLSMVDMARSIRQYEEQQRELMDSFIQLIAEAIDDKSPYTGGHCARVPELGLMLASAAHRSNEPPFDAFSFAGDDEFREFKIAAWLHDCGKITVPEHIVDKGSKLETIYNRIHEVRMRFEVLWRDAQIRYWQRLAVSPDEEETFKRELEAEQRKLQEDFMFVATTNVGGEFLDDSAVERLNKIAAQTWQRHFDDRLGLSPVEEMRVAGEAQALPATEPLLADRPEHIIPRTRSTDYAPHLGIRMEVPEHLYNLGELYNLSISRGTLSPEDRFKINEHMISTIKMLERLPFPAELSRVPRYASTHHEAMNGSGYPRKLTGDQLSIPEKVLVVADIFEALTAADRPYKKAKPVSVAVDILYSMVKGGHVDRDVFELFLRSGVYLEYARRFLPAAQIDEVDVAAYLRPDEQ